METESRRGRSHIHWRRAHRRDIDRGRMNIDRGRMNIDRSRMDIDRTPRGVMITWRVLDMHGMTRDRRMRMGYRPRPGRTIMVNHRGAVCHDGAARNAVMRSDRGGGASHQCRYCNCQYSCLHNVDFQSYGFDVRPNGLFTRLSGTGACQGALPSRRDAATLASHSHPGPGLARCPTRGQTPRPANNPRINRITKTARNRKNRNCAMLAAAPAIPVNPISPATSAMIANINAHFSMTKYRLRMRLVSIGRALNPASGKGAPCQSGRGTMSALSCL
jgi:hypothetical protein